MNLSKSEDKDEELIKKIMKDEKMFEKLNKEYPVNNNLDSHIEEVVKLMFVLLLKLTDLASNYQILIEDKEQFKKVALLWSEAISLRNKLHTAPEELKAIKDKIELLLKFRPSRDKKNNFQEVTKQSINKSADIKTKWREMQKPISKQYTSTLASIMLYILNGDITVQQLLYQIENYYLRAITFYNVIRLLEQTISYLYSKKIRADVMGWIVNICKLEHYSRLTISCGAQFEHSLREAFFGIVRRVLEYIAITKDTEELVSLIDTLKLEYTVNDYEELSKCKVFDVLHGDNNYVVSIWGKSLESASALLDVFEFIATKVIAQMNEGAALELLNSIVEVILLEVKKAANNYESVNGVDSSLVEQYLEAIKPKKKKDEDEANKDKKKIIQVFNSKNDNMYSQEFSVRVLNLLYRICVAVQDNEVLKNNLFKGNNIVYLFELLEIGSIQEQFIILQILPLIYALSNDNLDQAARKHLTGQKQLTQSGVLDLLLYFILRRRQGMWISEVKNCTRLYSITKTAIDTVQSILKLNRSVNTSFCSIIKSLMFSNKEEWNALPSELKSRQLAEILLSIAGGEFDSLYKGARVSILGKKEYNIISFEGTNTTEWEYIPNKHNQAILHSLRKDLTEGEIILMVAKVSELIPIKREVLLSQDIDKEQINDLLIKLIMDSLKKDMLLATIQVKMLKLLLNKSNLLSNEIINKMLIMGLKETKHDSLIITEFLVEEVRKNANKTKDETLNTPETSTSKVKVFNKEIMLIFKNASIMIPVIASKSSNKIRERLLDYCTFRDSDITEKVLFIEEAHADKILEVSKQVKAIITDASIEKFVEVKIPIAQISKTDIENLDKYKEQLMESNKPLEENKMSKVIANYLNSTVEINDKTNDARFILATLIKGNIQKELPKHLIKENPLRFFTQYTSKCDKMLSGKQNLQLRGEIEQMKRSYTSKYNRMSEKADSYLDLLNDLKVFYIRRLLLNYFKSSTHIDIEGVIDFFAVLLKEGYHLLYSAGYKELKKEVKEVLKRAISNEVITLDTFIDWINKGIEKQEVNPKEEVNISFLYECLNIFLKMNSKKVITHVNIKKLMANLLILVVSTEPILNKYQCILLLKQILARTQQLQDELSAQELSNIIANKAIQSLSTYCIFCDCTNSTLSKALNEVTLKAAMLYRKLVPKYGEDIVSHCVDDSKNLYIALRVIDEVTSDKSLMIYNWIKAHKKELKGVNQVRVDASKPMYSTDYCFLIEDPSALSFSLECKKSCDIFGLVSLDREMKVKLHSIDKNEEKVTIGFNKLYVHIPKDCYTVYAFGSNEGGRLGLKDIKGTTEPKSLSRIGTNRIAAIYSAGSHTILVDSKDVLYSSGKGEGRVNTDSMIFNEYIKRDTSKIGAVNEVATVLFDPAENVLCVIGKNTDKMFLSASNSCNEELIKLTEKGLKAVSISANHMLLLHGDNKLYGSSRARKELFGTWVDFPDNKLALIKLPDNIKAIKKILALNTGSILLCTDEKTGREELYSFGVESAAMGQGKGVQIKNYSRLLYSEGLEFIDIAGCETMAVGITKEGELYTWGKAYKGALALYNADGSIIEESFVPTKVTLPDNTSALNVSVGYNHMLVLVQSNLTHKHMVLGFGDNSKNQLGEEDVNVTKSVITFFEDKIPYLVSAGHGCSFVACGKKYKGIIHDEYTCEEHKAKVRDILYVKKTLDGIKYYCKECVIPDISIAIRNPITKLQERPLPLLDSLKDKKEEIKLECSSCKSKIEKGPVYKSAIKNIESITCEKCYMRTPVDFTLIIYYRVASMELLDVKEFPVFPLSEFYGTTGDSFSLVATPNYKVDLPKNFMEKEAKTSLETYSNEAALFSDDQNMEIVKLLNKYLIEEKKDLNRISLKEDLPLNYKGVPILSTFDNETLKQRAKILIKFNKILESVMESIDFESKSINGDVYSYYARAKKYVIAKTKDNLYKNITNSLAKVKGKPECLLDKRKANSFAMSGGVDYAGDHSLFGQLWRSLKDKVYQFCKPQKKNKLPFKVKFKGMEKVHAESAYRDLMNLIAGELQSTSLPLLVPTINKRIGLNNKWIPNPSANCLEMFEFLGSLLGMCMRQVQSLSLDLSLVFWKLVAGDSVDINDLRDVDSCFVDHLEEIKSGIKEDIYFVARLSDGSEIELKENGKSTKVDTENIEEYIQLITQARLNESIKQIKAIRTGMFKIIPQSAIKLYWWKELEMKMCGTDVITIEVLKKITEYTGCTEKDNHIQYFWKVLEEFTAEQLSLYLKFVWGRSRLPFPLEGISHCIHVKDSSKLDETLPTSRNEYFQLMLPKYISLEQTKTKLLEAISKVGG